MKPGPSLLIKATLIGSLVLCLFGYVATAGATAINTSTSEAAEASQNPGSAIIPGQPQLEQSASDQAAPVLASEQQQNQTGTTQNNNCEVSNNFPESIQQWCSLITQYAHQRDLSPNLVAAVMLQESGGDPQAYSNSGAVGLLQVMPRNGLAANFQCVNGPCFSGRPTIQQLEDPEYNLSYGTGMLANLYQKFGNIRDALSAYGPMNVGYSYADKVLSIYHNLGE